MTSDKCLYTFMLSVYDSAKKDETKGEMSFDRLAEDALNLIYYHDAIDARSKNLHRKYYGIATGLLRRATKLVLSFFKKSSFTYDDFKELLKLYNQGVVCPPDVAVPSQVLAQPSYAAQDDSPTPPDNSLYHHLTDHQIDLIAQIANEVNLFYEVATFEDIKGILEGRPVRELCTRNNRLLFIFVDYLRANNTIVSRWKKPLADQHCIRTMSKNKKVKSRRLLTPQDLYSACSAVAKYKSNDTVKKVWSKFDEHEVFTVEESQNQAKATL